MKLNIFFGILVMCSSVSCGGKASKADPEIIFNELVGLKASEFNPFDGGTIGQIDKFEWVVFNCYPDAFQSLVAEKQLEEGGYANGALSVGTLNLGVPTYEAYMDGGFDVWTPKDKSEEESGIYTVYMVRTLKNGVLRIVCQRINT